LKASIVAAGLDPESLPESDPSKMNFGSGGNTKAKAWKDIWGSGQGIGAMKAVVSAADYIARLKCEYETALADLCAIKGTRTSAPGATAS
jgi:nitronate monooxygenase